MTYYYLLLLRQFPVDYSISVKLTLLHNLPEERVIPVVFKKLSSSSPINKLILQQCFHKAYEFTLIKEKKCGMSASKDSSIPMELIPKHHENKETFLM